ncbi:MAG: bifunctional DNA-formamidopyrimidine glycosylase/DNA-(apurinic or apyrimidinic site) lyase [Hyphomicrobiales bacterium]
MPELPEVETVVRGLRPVLAGQRIASVSLRRADLRFPFPADFADRLAGRRVLDVARRAKYIVAGIEGGDCLLVHLGMTGRFTVLRPDGVRNLGDFYFETAAGDGADGAHDHVVFTLGDGTRLVYSDPRRFGLMDLFPASAAGNHKLLRDIGVEPLGNSFHAGYLAERFRGKTAPLKAALLDQRIIAGLGNIYVCEALFRSGLAPTRKAGSLARGRRADPRLETLVRHIRDILGEAIAAGGSTLQDFAQTDGAPGAFQQRFAVYDREGQACTRCGAPVKRRVQSGRSTFYCAACQR